MDVTSAPDILAKLFWIVTGIEVSGEKILHIGERIFNLEKAFNVRLGLTRKDDNFSVPEKFLEEPLKDGPFKGQIFHLDEMLDEYYEARGWGKDGLQTRKKLEELELREIADELMAQTKLSAF
jgi:aldehyde:ferredoxin oxidoreductase